jgi:transcriptional regulator with XRE-family HTH domain
MTMGMQHRTGRSDQPTRRACASRLRLLRARAGIETARKMAEEIGENENTYTRWERAETEPSISQILRICRVLGCTPNDLLLRARGIVPEE